MGIFVNHVHIFPEWMRPDGTVEAFRRVMERLDIGRAALWAPFPQRWRDAGGDASPGAQNRWLAGEIAGRPELVGYGTVDFGPSAAPMAAQVREIAELGLRGIKLHPAAQSFRIDGPAATAACVAAGDHGLPVSWHTGVHHQPLAECHPVLLDNVAHAAPQTRMVFEHVGGWHFYRDVVAVIQNNTSAGRPKRLFAGLTTVFSRERFRGWYLGPAVLEELRWQLGEDALIYGTDFPHNQGDRIAADLEEIRALGWTAAATDAVLGGNLSRLLGV